MHSKDIVSISIRKPITYVYWIAISLAFVVSMVTYGIIHKRLDKTRARKEAADMFKSVSSVGNMPPNISSNQQAFI